MRLTLSYFLLAMMLYAHYVVSHAKATPLSPPQSTERVKFVRELGHEFPLNNNHAQKKDAMMSGFQLHSIFAQHVSHSGDLTMVHRVVPDEKEEEEDVSGEKIRRKKRRSILYDRDGSTEKPSGIPTESNARAGFQSSDDFSDTLNELTTVNVNDPISGAKVRGVLKLNWISEDLYGNMTWIEESKRKPYRETGEQMYDNRDVQDVGGALSDEAVTRQIVAYIRTQVDNIGTVGDYSAPGGNANGGTTRGAAGVGVAAMMFKKSGTNEKVLVFRGSRTEGDFQNAAALIMGNILYDQDGAGMQEILESNWEKVGLARLDAFDTRAKTESLQYKIVLGAGFLLSGMEMIGEDFEGNLASAVNDKSIGPASNGKVGSLSKGEAEDLGYFAATMQIMDAIYDEDSSVELLISGYSQGGGRAQLARMYVEEKYGKKPPVITIASGGGPRCYSRHLFEDGRTNYLKYVDPTRYYENVYDYAHFLDPWAALGYNIGETCLFGNADGDVTQSRAYKYCSKFVGYPASVVVGKWASSPLQDDSWADNFDACRYFSHYLQGITQQLSSDLELKADGTTGNGCTSYEGWPLSDKRCPVEDDALRRLILAAIIGISFACLLFVILVVLCICRRYRCGVYQRKGCCCQPYDDVAGITAPQWKSVKVSDPPHDHT
ncbi:unnamed protein product [Bathycoccus prasinos]|jgi:hypothetical protein|tara:strand:+ start:360 stop:2345 length:1986 start_codon:yes stop_codon:yes gene_type:complete